MQPETSDLLEGVSRETLDGLERLSTLVQQWSAKIALLSKADQSEIWTRHILDSAQLWPLRGSAKHWLDLGSGSGFPGLVLAELSRSNNGSVMMVDSTQKKAAYLRNVVAALHLPAKVVWARVESVRPTEADIITARAFAPLVKLFELSAPHIQNAGRALLHKGRDHRAEIDEASRHWSFDVVVHPSQIDAAGVILEVTNLERR